MVTWHNEERVEVGALQLINVLFWVPQLSIFLTQLPQAHVEMVEFYKAYWNENRDTLLHGEYLPSSPLANYSTQGVSKEDLILSEHMKRW